MTTTTSRAVILLLALALLVCAPAIGRTLAQDEQSPAGANGLDQAPAMRIHDLEIITPDVDATCAALGKAHGVTFGDPVPEIGAARTATLASGGRIGVRAPMHEQERSVVRPYVLVDDLDAAVRAAEAAGAEIALPRMDIPGQGTIAIYFLGGIEHGLWEN